MHVCVHVRPLLYNQTIESLQGHSQNFCSGLTSPPLYFPSPPSLSFPCLFPSHPFPILSPQIPPGLGEHCKLPQRGLGLSAPDPGHKRILAHLRLSKCMSWQHLSVVYMQCRHLHDGSSRYVFVDSSNEKIPVFQGGLNPLTPP